MRALHVEHTEAEFTYEEKRLAVLSALNNDDCFMSRNNNCKKRTWVTSIPA